MVLYRVSSSGIVKLDVKRETKCGWTQHNGGFIRRSELYKFSRYTSGDWYFTTNKDEAIQWGITLRDQMFTDYNALGLSIAELS